MRGTDDFPPQLILPPHVAAARMEQQAPGARRAPADDDFRVATVEDQLAKSIGERLPQEQPYRLSLLPSAAIVQGVNDPPHDHNSQHDMLRLAVIREPILWAIIKRRISQATRFTREARFDGDVGFKIRNRNRRGRTTAASRKLAEEITALLLRGGYYSDHPETGERAVWDAEFAEKAPGLRLAIETLVRDSLTLDAAAWRIEVGRNARRYPCVFYAPVDAALIRYTTSPDKGKHATPDSYASREPYQPEIRKKIRPSFVMLNRNGLGIQREFRWDELQYLVRNPRSDEQVQGYGQPEGAVLVNILTGILLGTQYNIDYLDKNYTPPGVLTLIGKYGEDALRVFRQQLRMMCGPRDWWKLPIIASEQGIGGQFIPLRQHDQAGMFWKELILYLVTTACAGFGMDSTEINFVNFGTSSSSLGQGQPFEKLQNQQEMGLVPLMVAVEDFIQPLIERIDSDFCFEFTGIRDRDEQLEAAAEQLRMANGRSTPNMERARRDEPPIRDPLDPRLWKQVREAVADHLRMDPADLDTLEDPQVSRLMERAYEKAGGEWARWPDAPVGNPSALSVWMTEHKVGQDEMETLPPHMADQAGGEQEADPNNPNQQGGFPPQPGQAGPQGEGGEPAGAPAALPAGPPQGPPQGPPKAPAAAAPAPGQPFGKNLFSLTLRPLWSRKGSR